MRSLVICWLAALAAVALLTLGGFGPATCAAGEAGDRMLAHDVFFSLKDNSPQAREKLVPGIASRHTLLYGVEVKFYSFRPELTPCLETEIQNLFTAGDGAGISRGLIQASASGVVVAREILRRNTAPSGGQE